MPSVRKTSSSGAVNLASLSRIRDRNGAVEIHRDVPRVLGDPDSAWMGPHAPEVHRPRTQLDEEQACTKTNSARFLVFVSGRTALQFV